MSGGGAATSEVLTYLEVFERIRVNASLLAVYGVVVVPILRDTDLVEPPVLDALQYTPPQPVLNLSIHRAIYHVNSRRYIPPFTIITYRYYERDSTLQETYDEGEQNNKRLPS